MDKSQAFRDDLAARANGSALLGSIDPKLGRFDRLGEMTEAQFLALLEHRGGCACSWPTACPPCWRCTNPLSFAEADELGWLDESDEIELSFAIVPAGPALTYSDFCGIAAMAAKDIQPASEPVVSIGGVQATEAEFAAALQLVRQQSAPAVKGSPRGLLMVTPIDHRLGRWNEA